MRRFVPFITIAVVAVLTSTSLRAELNEINCNSDGNTNARIITFRPAIRDAEGTNASDQAFEGAKNYVLIHCIRKLNLQLNDRVRQVRITFTNEAGTPFASGTYAIATNSWSITRVAAPPKMPGTGPKIAPAPTTPAPGPVSQPKPQQQQPKYDMATELPGALFGMGIFAALIWLAANSFKKYKLAEAVRSEERDYARQQRAEQQWQAENDDAERRRRHEEEQREANRQREKERYQDAKQQSEQDDWWKVLEVSRDASLDVVRDSYRRLIKQYHPDNVSRLGPEFAQLAEARTKALNAAYERAKRERATRS
jgi:DnaJ like chaperone protein